MYTSYDIKTYITVHTLYVMQDRNRPVCSFTLDKDTHNKLRDLADLEGRTVSNMCARIIKDHLDRIK